MLTFKKLFSCCFPTPLVGPSNADKNISSEESTKDEIPLKKVNNTQQTKGKKKIIIRKPLKKTEDPEGPVKKQEGVKRKKDTIPKKVRDAVWVKYHGDKNVGICYCCGKEIQRYNAGWHCSHILSDVKGGEEIVENLTTCCPHCNLSMGSQNLYVYMKENNMQGPGKENIEKYLKEHPDQINDKRDSPNQKKKKNMMSKFIITRSIKK